jgi:hypothetical protein
MQDWRGGGGTKCEERRAARGGWGWQGGGRAPRAREPGPKRKLLPRRLDGAGGGARRAAAGQGSSVQRAAAPRAAPHEARAAGGPAQRAPGALLGEGWGAARGGKTVAWWREDKAGGAEGPDLGAWGPSRVGRGPGAAGPPADVACAHVGRGSGGALATPKPAARQPSQLAGRPPRRSAACGAKRGRRRAAAARRPRAGRRHEAQPRAHEQRRGAHRQAHRPLRSVEGRRAEGAAAKLHNRDLVCVWRVGVGSGRWGLGWQAEKLGNPRDRESGHVSATPGAATRRARPARRRRSPGAPLPPRPAAAAGGGGPTCSAASAARIAPNWGCARRPSSTLAWLSRTRRQLIWRGGTMGGVLSAEAGQERRGRRGALACHERAASSTPLAPMRPADPRQPTWLSSCSHTKVLNSRPPPLTPLLEGKPPAPSPPA